jgi:intracellular septation protein
MKFLYDLLPLLLFFAAFRLYDIYVATVVAVVASIVQVGLYWLKHRRFEMMHLVTLGVLVVFGGLTVLLRDDTFIKWKPTLVYWIIGVAFLASHWIGKKPLAERLLGSQIDLPGKVWARQNMSWAVFFLATGALNLYVAFYYRPELDETARQAIWVNFKVFGLMGLTLAFTLAQGIYLARYLNDKPQSTEER